MAELIRAGADVFRLNFSHGGRDEHAANVAMAREASRVAGREVGLLGDLPGAEAADRRGGGRRGRASSGVRADPDHRRGDRRRRSPAGLLGGAAGGGLRRGRGLPRRRPGAAARARGDARRDSLRGRGRGRGRLPPGTEHARDRGPAALCQPTPTWTGSTSRSSRDIDLLAVSFVRRAEDLEPVERRVRAGGADIPLIAKIEKPQAAENAEAIIRAALSGIMVARGDLGIEIPIERVPTVQRQLLALAGRHSRPSITATQMLASMVASSRPTRAEVSDVAAAIFQGTDAVMLSEETAVGEHPVEAVRLMDRIAHEAEPDLPYGDWLFNRVASETVGRGGLRRPRGRRLDLHARARRRGRPDPQRPHGAARLGAPAQGAGAGRLTPHRDGAPAAAPVRRQVRPRRGLDEPADPARRLRPTGQASKASPAAAT